MRPKVLFEYSNAFNQGFLELPPALKTRGTSRERLALGTGSHRRCRSQGTAILRKSKTMPRREKKNVQRCTPTTAPVLEGLCKCAFININTCVCIYIYMCVCVKTWNVLTNTKGRLAPMPRTFDMEICTPPRWFGRGRESIGSFLERPTFLSNSKTTRRKNSKNTQLLLIFLVLRARCVCVFCVLKHIQSCCLLVLLWLHLRIICDAPPEAHVDVEPTLCLRGCAC